MDNSVDLQLILDTGKNPPSVKSVSKAVVNEERLAAILESAYQYALKKGIESEMRAVRAVISKNERNLDAIYNFSPLMIDRVVPPVITVTKDIVQNPNESSIKTTGVVYKIEKQAYFSTLPPNWRTYLTFPETSYAVDVTETPTKDLMPKGGAELTAWNKRVTAGFTEGQKVAQDMFKHGLNKLNRDYMGIVRFHQFVLEGKINMPTLNRAELAVSNNGSIMSIDQKMLNIRTLPSFVGNTLKWTAWLTPVKYNPGGQAATYDGAE